MSSTEAERKAAAAEWRVIRLLVALAVMCPLVALVLGFSVRLFLAVSGIAGGH